MSDRYVNPQKDRMLMDEVCDLMRLQHYAIQTERAYCSTFKTEGSLERRHSTARTSAPGDEAVWLTFPIDMANRWSAVRVRHPCFAVQAKTDENPPDFPPESLLKDKQEAECQDQWLIAHGQPDVYSSYIPRPPASALSVQWSHKAYSVSRTARSGCVDYGLMPASTTLPTRLPTAAAILGLLRATAVP